MSKGLLTNEQNYQFDVAGYLIVPGVLGADEVQACNQALDQGVDPAADGALALLRDHALLACYLEQILGQNYRLDQGPRLLGEGDQAGELIQGAGARVDWARAYRHYDGERFCQGVQAVWALANVGAGAGGLVVVPASHNSTVDAPQDLLQGNDDMGLAVQPELGAGDLLLLADSLTRGMRPWHRQGVQRLLEFGYSGADVRPGPNSEIAGAGDVLPDWAAELSEVERQVLHNPDRPYPPRIVKSDGDKTWLEKEPGVYHPSIYKKDPDSGIDDKEFYSWDLCGHLILRGLMDEKWLAAANEAIDANPDRISHGGSAAGDSGPLAGQGTVRSSMGDPWTLPKPHGEPFRRMIAHPALIQRLNWIMGSGFECMMCNGFLSARGSSGHTLHAGVHPARVTNHYRQQNGRVYAEYLNVAWQLRDVGPGDGGFVCVPGSHKTNYPMPDCIKHCDDELGLVRHIEMKAGDVLLFLASAQAHGAYPWMGAENRRMIFFQYRSRNLYAP
ncbi:MAG: hypothetical protein GKR89_35780 [Candidatus Latescibacteria bacterium]|nr:hypothetical protein [Candidatus Latescibacterota bacterium]